MPINMLETDDNLIFLVQELEFFENEEHKTDQLQQNFRKSSEKKKYNEVDQLQFFLDIICEMASRIWLWITQAWLRRSNYV